TVMALGVATQPHVIDDLCIQMDNLEYRHGVLMRKIETTLQTTLHGAELQNQQLRTRVAEMESREGTIMSYMMWMEERLTVLEKRLPQPPSRPQ
ncbi:hypothetical protein Tco_0355432, partial [Tanacetum coccineum]